MPIINDAALAIVNFLARSFKLGPAIVQSTDRTFGHSNDEFSPAEYGEYIAKSNAVYTCANMRADLIAGMNLKGWRKGPSINAKPVEVTNSKAIALLNYVNPHWSGNRLRRMTELSLCLWGKSVWFVERGESGLGPPKEIWWARPDRVRVVPDPQTYIKGFLYRPLSGGQDIFFAPSETVWMPYANPLDEFDGLSPIAAARLAAEYGTEALKSNRNLFRNGIQAGGLLTPPAGKKFTPEAAQMLEEDLDRRFRGVDKAHRWGVLETEATVTTLGMTARDAEFVKGQSMALEDVCRAYKIPPDLVGGQRTYANVEAAQLGLHDYCIKPEAAFITDELKEKFLPMFKGDADYFTLETENIAILSEARGRLVTQMQQLCQMGVPLNKVLAKFMPDLLPDDPQGYPWGNVWFASAALSPIRDDSEKAPPPAPALPGAETQPPAKDTKTAAEQKTQPPRSRNVRAVEYGSDEHARIWRAYTQRADPHEVKVGKACAELFRRQQDSVLARLKARGKRDLEDLVDEPFDKAEWIKKFRVELRPVIKEVIAAFGASALDDLGLSIAFDVLDPNVVRFLEQRTQRFARNLNDTTWNDLKAALSEGVDAGESISDLAARVEAVMGDRIDSSAENIARTEVLGASNGGTLLSWQQSDVVDSKTWLASLDPRTRETHLEAHRQYQANPIPLDEDFEVGEASGPAPGQMGDPEEDCQCRCTMQAVLKERALSVSAHKELVHA